MAAKNITFAQINLQHCKAATAIHSRDLAVEQTDVSLIQEPWVYRGTVRGIDTTIGKLIYAEGEPGPRAGIFTNKRVNALKLNQFCSRDLAAAKIKAKRGGGGWKDIVVCSAYLPYDSEDPPPTEELRALTRYCKDTGLDLLIGCDANSHHSIWGSSNDNERGAALLEFLSAAGLEILNKGSRPTYVTSRRQEVIDLTLCTSGLTRHVGHWKVRDEETLSDHRRITFTLEVEMPEGPTNIYRNPRATNWTTFKEELDKRLKGKHTRPKNKGTVEAEVTNLQTSIIQAYEAACPAKEGKGSKKVPWWNKELGKLRTSSRKLLNRALKTDGQEDWAAYREAQRTYKKLTKK